MRPTMTHLALHVPDLEVSIRFYASYCGLRIVHDRGSGGERVVWMAEEGREDRFVLVLIPGGEERRQGEHDYSHLGFAVESRSAVDQIARKAQESGILVWPPVEGPDPVGYFCGVRAPEGRIVEFSFGQPLGPGGEWKASLRDGEPRQRDEG
ncbi:MAG: VOC family protein [Deltaproteobacteria bacterium]|nr:MAG: VOC family protein [Deltaproteobacteria bacterium]